MADQAVDFNKAVRPFRQLQAYASQSLSSLFAEFERLEGLVITLAHYSLPAELVEFTQFNNLPEVVAEGPAEQYSRPRRSDSTPGGRPRTKPGARERRKEATRPGPGTGQEPEEPSRPGKQRPAPAGQPVFPVSARNRRPGPTGDVSRPASPAPRAGTPAALALSNPERIAAEGDHRPAQDHPVSPGEGSRPEERRPTEAGDLREGSDGQERPAPPAGGTRRRWRSAEAAGQIGTGNNGWRLLDTLSDSLLLEGAGGNGRDGPAGRRPRSGAQLQRPPEGRVGRDNRPFTAPFSLGRGPGEPGEARAVVEELDPITALPPQGPRFRPGSGEHSPIDMDRLAEWINELLQDQARRHGVQIE